MRNIIKDNGRMLMMLSKLVIVVILSSGLLYLVLKSNELSDSQPEKKIDAVKLDSYNVLGVVHDREVTTSLSSKIQPHIYNKTIDYQAEVEKLNMEKVAADDPRLIELIDNYYINRPSEQPYNLSKPEVMDTSMGQAQCVDSQLNYKEDGFFIECGAHDGEFLSNTLFLERIRNWSGLLVEPLPEVYRQLHNKHRRAVTINACLSVHPYPAKETMSNIPLFAKILQQQQARKKSISVQCFPLYSILLAMQQTTVDYLSLDVEGVELAVLEAIPWDKVDIRMVGVEYNKWPGGNYALHIFMKERGYKWLTHITTRNAADAIFIKYKTV